MSSLTINRMTEGERSFVVGVRMHGIRNLLFDLLDPDEERRGDENLDEWDLLVEKLREGDGEAETVELVSTLLDRAFNLGYDLAVSRVG